ncbi:flagellar basal-body rod protein FlgF [Psychrobacillus glaciei]|uniref:Flagellar basal-body rod protein FlgF n=1 Tax=Psychrobacillus glaciei TaxID=2283160 RepID=A0A5J6SL19_9BACI|nr:flagellar basal-body rod protein FlgF [Psychrobacillus glaciei]QFF98538.1 flagellar basal-body rod protein FlgF [Psychrobacillus glaciei]
MIRSMYSGISGLKNFQTKLDVIGNNIANVNTYGFKKGRTVFKDLISQTTAGASAATATRGGVNAKQVGLGSQLSAIDTIHSGGALQSTGNTLDLAISGDGFFQVADSTSGLSGFTNTQYTRAGNFYMDQDGYLVDSAGKYLVGAAGSVTEIPLYKLITETVAGTSGSYLTDGNGGLSEYRIDSSGNIYDDTTPATPIKLITTIDNASGTIPNADGTDKEFELKIDSSTGVVSVVIGSKSYPIEHGNDKVEVDGKTLTLNSTDLTTLYTAIEGSREEIGTTDKYSPSNQLKPIRIPTDAQSMSIGQDGTISFVDKNGELQWAGQIQMAKFPNAGGLQKIGANYFQETANSGKPLKATATESGMGSINSGFLEMSNVDLSEEFTDMIVAQRGFQANTRIITTSDSILEELINLKR